MTFTLWHASAEEPPIRVPAIGLELRVCLPPSASAGAMSIIETTNLPGDGPPLHRHPDMEVFRVLEGRYLYERNGHRAVAEVMRDGVPDRAALNRSPEPWAIEFLEPPIKRE